METPEEPEQQSTESREMTPTPSTMPSDESLMPVRPKPQEPPWERVDSSNVHAIRRTTDGSTYVQFRNRDGSVSKVYHYDGVPDIIYEKMRTADSVGRFFHNQIKQVYKTRALSESEEEEIG